MYNRCIGTRDCNRCPWKVRRFNWHQWKRDYPLEWQLNPDVTVREQGVMEKCSFCIQRIIYAKTKATSEGRKVRDGEFTTACAQTCPVDAITFGNLMDPQSRDSRSSAPRRAPTRCWAGSIPKTAVIYLEKITQGDKDRQEGVDRTAKMEPELLVKIEDVDRQILGTLWRPPPVSSRWPIKTPATY